MSSYQLSCCSTADLSAERFAARDIAWVPFHFELDGVMYPDDLGASIPFDDFYAAMQQGAKTKTSQVSVGEYLEHFKAILNQDKDILHVSLSSGLSGSYQSACIAAQQLRSSYPARKIFVVDSLGASSGYGLLMDTLADKRDEGLSIDALAQWAEEHRLMVHHWFFSTDLTFYVRGGRVSKTAGFVGTMLHICPLLNMDYQGHLIPREKIRSKHRALQAALQKMKEHAQDGTSYTGKVFICHSACEKDAQTLAHLVSEAFPHLAEEVQIFPIGTTIGSHTGPGTISLFFWGDERTPE